MNKRKILFLLLLGVLLTFTIVFLCKYKKQQNIYSCYHIPLADGKLDWGMDTNELISIAGEPISIKHEEYMDILTYSNFQLCDLGDCTQAVFYIGIDDKSYNNGIFSSGLGGIELTVDDGSKESILKSLVGFYGNLSPHGGETQMETQLKDANPGYFNQYHFREEWRAGNLPEKSFNRLSQVKETAERMGVLVEKDTPLMYMNFWETDGSPCTIHINASVLASYLKVED